MCNFYLPLTLVIFVVALTNWNGIQTVFLIAMWLAFIAYECLED